MLARSQTELGHIGFTVNWKHQDHWSILWFYLFVLYHTYYWEFPKRVFFRSNC